MTSPPGPAGVPSSFFARAGTLTVGAAAGQILVILALPALTRLYSPAQFGALGVFAAFLGTLAAVSTLRYELAIPLAKSDEDAASAVMLSGMCGAAVSLLVALFVTGFGGHLTTWTNTPDLERHLWLLPFATCAAAIYQSLNLWNIRKGMYNRIAATRFYQSAVTVGTQLSLGALHVGTFGLVFGQVAGAAGGSLALARSYRAAPRGNWYRQLPVLARRYLRFPVFSAPAALLASLSLLLPAVFMAAIYGPAAAGFFLLVQRVLGAPMGLIGQSVASVYLGDIAQLMREDVPDEIRSRYLQLTRRLSLLALTIVLPLLLAGPLLFTAAFGAVWADAGQFARILALPFALQLVTSPLSQTMNVMGRQAWQLAWDIVRASGVVAIFIISIHLSLPATVAIALYAVTMTLMYVVLWTLGWASLSRRRLTK